jgi:hypothetical protein
MTMLVSLLAIGANAVEFGSDTIVVQDDPVSFSVSAGFESEYTFRGESVADNVYTANINATLYGAYVGVEGFYQAESTDAFESEVDLYAGYTIKNLIVDWVDIDFGVKAYVYPHASGSDTDYTYEAYVGFILDEMLLNPAAYVYYDVKRQAATIEASLSESITTTNGLPVLGQVTFTPKVYAGYTDINDVTPKSVNTDVAYTYLGGAIDVSVEVKGVEVSVGPRYVTTQTDNPQFDANELSFGGRVAYRF